MTQEFIEEEIVLELDLKVFNSIIHSDEYYDLIKELETKMIEESDKRMEPYQDNIPLSNYYTLLVLANPFRVMEKEFTEEYLVNPTDIKSYYTYFDKIISKFLISDELNDKTRERLCQSLAFIIDTLTIHAVEHVLPVDGPSISLKDILRLADENETIDRLINFSSKDIDPNLTYQEVINDIQNPNMRLLNEEIIKDEFNDYKTFIKSGTGLNLQQLNEMISVVGFKPDIRGNVDTDIIDTSFARGLKTLNHFYTDAESALNALTNSKNKVKESGYLNRKSSLLTANVKLSKSVKDCKTKMYFNFNMSSEKFLDIFVDRYYLNDDGKLELITKDHKHLIGQTIQVRSPMTCANDPEDGICHTCYGNILSLANKGLNVGIIATLILTAPMTQKLLSTKHNLVVKISKFKWSQVFLDHFEFNKDYIIPRNEKIKIIIEDLEINDNYDFNRYKTDRFKFKVGNKTYSVESPIKLIIPDKNIENIDIFHHETKPQYEFTMKDLKENHLFEIKIKNESIAGPLLKIRSILEGTTHIREDYNSTDYDAMANDLIHLLIDSGTNIKAIHLEVIASAMLFVLNKEGRAILADEENYQRAQFLIRHVSSAILHSKSSIQSIIFENIKAQLNSDDINGFFSKTGSSVFDPLFDFDMYEE